MFAWFHPFSFSLYLTVKLFYGTHTRYPTSTTSQKIFSSTVTTCILLSLCRTSAPIHLTIVLSVLGTQETSCFLIAGLLERAILGLYLPKFDKPWITLLRETYCCSTNLC